MSVIPNFYTRLTNIHNLWKKEVQSNNTEAQSLCILRGKYVEEDTKSKQPQTSLLQ